MGAPQPAGDRHRWRPFMLSRIVAKTLLRFPAGKNEYAHTGSDGEHADRGRNDYALPPFGRDLNRLRIDDLLSLASGEANRTTPSKASRTPMILIHKVSAGDISALSIIFVLRCSVTLLRLG